MVELLVVSYLCEKCMQNVNVPFWIDCDAYTPTGSRQTGEGEKRSTFGVLSNSCSTSATLSQREDSFPVKCMFVQESSG